MLRRDHRVVPLYYQVQHLIAERINKGEYRPGSQIPSESEISREMGVSRVTVREALRALAQQKVLVKVHGKGTFVAVHFDPARGKRKFTGYLEDLYDQLEKVTVKHVEIGRVPVSDELRSQLALADGASEVVQVKRMRFVNNSPYAFTINRLPLEIGSHLNTDNLRTRPLVRIIEEDLRIPIVSAHETIEAAAADSEVAEWLDVTPLSPVMHVNRVLFGVDDRPIQVVDSYYRADKYQYSVELMRVQHNGRWSWSQPAKRASA